MRFALVSLWKAFDKTYLFWGFVGGVALGFLETVI